MIVYYNNKYLPLEKVSISPFDRGFMFADGVYEAIRTYNGKLFKIDEHLKRLQRSLDEVKIKYNDLEKLEGVIYRLIKQNNIEAEALMYLQITRGSSIPRTHSFPDKSVKPTLLLSAIQLKINKQEQQGGVKVSLLDDNRWMRCDIKSISLLPVVLANQKAKELGSTEAILVRNGLITEGTHTNFFAVKDGVLYTAPVSNYILSGITRGIVIKLANKLNINVKEVFIKETELKNFTELFITSTTKEITPVVKIDDWVINEGRVGIITAKLQNNLSKLTDGF